MSMAGIHLLDCARIRIILIDISMHF
jgi:hypothetical protein